MMASILLCPPAHASPREMTSPQAVARTHAQNYKDLVLANCLAQAYRNEAGASADIGSSVSALRDWTYFDMEKSPDAVKSLVDSYLARDYSNPLVESEIKGIRFDFLKCMDLYHSKALEDLVKRLVVHPKRVYKQGP
ncbi:type VI secretion system amidase immunity protein Tai4 [Telluria beijingensis]|uniref:type VI secretion system amidase immunity protein Tai4 n=1 Tax=Telluria beijingensis TaxID=3068633 RepID=UPI00279548BF|nr:type VI secretion system amidase immunity protein Tai4 [Massilia sp. REN29]